MFKIYIKFIVIITLIFCNNNNVYANSYKLINKNNYEIIKESLKNNNSISINLEYNSEDLIVKRQVLDLIKNKTKSITYNIYDDNQIIYSFTFYGKNINTSYNDINLKIYFTTNKDNELNKIFKEKLVFETEYKGYFPKDTILSIKNNNKIKKVNIYTLDNKSDLYIIKTYNNNNNFIDINIEKGDIYIITNKSIVNFDIIKMYISIIIIISIEILIIFLIYHLKKDKN